LDDLHKVFCDGHGTKCRRNIAKNYNRLSRVHERDRQTDRRQTRDRRQTDGRVTAYSESRSRSLKWLPILESDAEYHLMENMAAFGETVTSHLFILQGHQSQKHAQLCTLFRK